MEKITKDNYKDRHDHLSYSRVSKFLSCEAAAAVGYYEPSNVSQLVGSYVDAHFSNELEEFNQEHPEIFNSRTGALKADFEDAKRIIERIEKDETFMKLLSGEKQKIMTGIIEGVPFKIKMDSYIENEMIVDLKVMKDFKKVWSDTFKRYVSFIQAYDYDIEMAIFQEIVYQNTGKKLPCVIAAITKEKPSDVCAFKISQKALDEALLTVKKALPRIKKILDGEIAPHRCEKCSYCRETKKMRILDSELVGASGDELRELGYECNDPKLTKEVQNENN